MTLEELMAREVKLSQSISKTIAGVELGRQCLIVFTDDSFATLSIDRGWEPGDEEIKEEESLDVFEFGDEVLSRAGLLTPDEMRAIRRQREEKDRAARFALQEAYDRLEFERLKKKFGGGAF